jgi:hypothetical protein
MSAAAVGEGIEKLAALQAVSTYYFGRLDDNTDYSIDSSLMS